MKLMRMTLLLLAILALPYAAVAQGGYDVSRVRGLDKVVATGNNQAVPAVVLTSRAAAAEPAITRPANTDITLSVKFGDLPIVQATAWTVDGATVTQVVAQTTDFDDTADNIQFKMGDKELLIFIDQGATGGGVGAGTMIKLADIRLDLTSLSDGDAVSITVAGSDQADTIGLGTGGGRGSVTATLTTASDGLSVSAVKGDGLTCGSIEGASVTVAEGFAGAWMPALIVPEVAANGLLEATQSGGNDHATAMDAVGGSVMVRLDVMNFPDTEGAKIEWPGTVNDARDDADPNTAGDQGATIATLTLDKDASDANGKFAIYSYANVDSLPQRDPGTPADATDDVADPTINPYLSDAARSFKVEGLKFTNFGGAEIGVTARLWPMAKRNSDGKKNAADLKSVLSFEHAAEDPEFADDARDGAWLIVSDCVTYLLYPFVTCGGTAGWSTGITVSNTSADAHVFGPFDESTEQSGSVIMYGFPQGQAAPAEGEMVEPVVSTLSTNLMAGDTIVADCGDTTMAGMDGYAIIMIVTLEGFKNLNSS